MTRAASSGKEMTQEHREILSLLEDHLTRGYPVSVRYLKQLAARAEIPWAHVEFVSDWLPIEKTRRPNGKFGAPPAYWEISS